MQFILFSYRCDNIDVQNFTSFHVMMGVSVTFVVTSLLSSYCMNKFNLKHLVGMFNVVENNTFYI